jgi:hypothetical protein
MTNYINLTNLHIGLSDGHFFPYAVSVSWQITSSRWTFISHWVMGISFPMLYPCHDRSRQPDESLYRTEWWAFLPLCCIYVMTDHVNSMNLHIALCDGHFFPYAISVSWQITSTRWIFISHWVMGISSPMLYLCHDRSHQLDESLYRTEWWGFLPICCIYVMTDHINPTNLRIALTDHINPTNLHIALSDGHFFPMLYLSHDSCSP